MAEVYIDGEKVVFDGEPPAKMGDLTNLLAQALAQNGRVVASVTINEDPNAAFEPHDALSSYSRVDIGSLSRIEAQAQVCAATLGSLRDILKRLDELATNVLRSPWSEVMDECIKLIRELSVSLEDVGALTGVQGVDAASEDTIRAIESWMDTVQCGDAAKVSLVSDGLLAPALQGLVEKLVAAGGHGRE